MLPVENFTRSVGEFLRMWKPQVDGELLNSEAVSEEGTLTRGNTNLRQGKWVVWDLGTIEAKLNKTKQMLRKRGKVDVRYRGSGAMGRPQNRPVSIRALGSFSAKPLARPG
jgi:hypothetical protein